MDECELRDDWSRECIDLPLVVFQILSGILSSMIALLVGLFIFYMYLCKNAKRPKVRGISFALMIFGLSLGIPKFVWRVANPALLPSKNVGLHALFAVGDVASHVGFIMLIYWDIVNEGIRLAFALDPVSKRRNMKISTVTGFTFMVVEVLFLTPFWTLVSNKEGLFPELGRATLCASFAVVQYVLVFGAVPSVAFVSLVWSLYKLWKDLPGDIPRHLLYRLRYTQLCLALLTCLGVTDVLAGSNVGFVPLFRTFSGFLYEFVALISLCSFTMLLLGIELFLTYQQARRRIKSPESLEEDQVRKLVENGVSLLESLANTESTVVAPPLESLQLPAMPPVWERGLGQGLAGRFFGIYAGDVGTKEDPATSDLCIHLVKPMTARARCSMWECLATGFSLSRVLAGSHKDQYLAKPTVMVSHCWSSSYRELMLILKRFDENTDRSNYFFLDVFSMNQHDFADLGTAMDTADLRDMYDTMLEALTQSIKVPGCMLLALTPHERPKMLTRSWCLYEIYIAWKVGAEVSCGFIPEAEQSMKQSLTKDDRLIRHMLNTINAEESSATVKTDRDMILTLIHNAGTQRFNSFVREKLRSSLRMVALTTLREVEGTADDEIEVLSPKSDGAGSSPSTPVSPSAQSDDRTRSAFIHGSFSKDRNFHSEGSTFSF